MRTSFIAQLVATALVASGTVAAGEEAEQQNTVFEQAVRAASNAEYRDILRQAWSKGLRFTPEQVEHGANRHFEEWKLRLIDQGYTILAGEAGA